MAARRGQARAGAAGEHDGTGPLSGVVRRDGSAAMGSRPWPRPRPRRSWRSPPVRIAGSRPGAGSVCEEGPELADYLFWVAAVVGRQVVTPGEFGSLHPGQDAGQGLEGGLEVGRTLTAAQQQNLRGRPGEGSRGENSCLVRRVAEGKNVFHIADWSYELGRMGVRAGLLVRWWRVSGLRLIAGPFVAAAPAGTRVRARLRVSPQDEAVLRAAGNHLGSLAGGDLAARCAEGRLDPMHNRPNRRGHEVYLCLRSDQYVETFRPKFLLKDAGDKQWQRKQDGRNTERVTDAVHGMAMTGAVLRDPLLVSASAQHAEDDSTI